MRHRAPPGPSRDGLGPRSWHTWRRGGPTRPHTGTRPSPARASRRWNRCARASGITSGRWPPAGERAHDPPRPRQSVHERRLSHRAPVPRHRLVAGLRPAARRQRVHRAVLPHPRNSSSGCGISRTWTTCSRPSLGRRRHQRNQQGRPGCWLRLLPARRGTLLISRGERRRAATPE